MLIVAGQFSMDPSNREEFLRSREDAMRNSRTEPGCITYVFSPDPLEPGLVHLFERWESREALGAHVRQMRGKPPTPSPFPVTISDFEQYEIAKITPLG
jgi:quinol monooxygenase YgiN